MTYENQKAKHYDIDPETGYIIPNLHQDVAFMPKRKVELIKFLEEKWNIPRACKYIGIDIDTLYRHLNWDSKFKKDFETVLQLHLGDTEQYIHETGKKNFIPALAFLKRYDKRWVEKQQLALPQEQNEKLDNLLRLIDSKIIDVPKQLD